jgi:endonuclease/exonuclease/phosphatase family metal-dependent hydrolase
MKLLQYLLIGLILLSLNTCSVAADPLKVITYNLESNSLKKTNPRLVAQDLQLIPPADIWGLTEVGNENDARIFHNAISQGKSHYGSILGKTGAGDRLQITFNTQRLKLINNQEIPNIGGTRAPLVAQFEFIPNQQEFLFVVNHFNRSDTDKRELQAENFRQWARSQQLPIIAVGDYNFDFSLSTQKGNQAYNIFTVDDTFTWLKPSCLTTNTCPSTGTQCNSRYDGILDFIFLGNQAQQWQGSSEILFIDQPVCQKNPRGYADHYPVAGEIHVSAVGNT